MKSYVFAALLCSTGLAHASESVRLYDPPPADAEALRRASALAESCAYSEMSRIGPSVTQAARCEHAEQKLLSLGARAVPAVLHALDANHDLFGAAVPRYYDVLARSGDPSVVDSLVGALEKLEGQPESKRNAQWYFVESTLERISHSALSRDASAASWRAWADAHRAKPVTPAQVQTTEGKPQTAGKPVS